MTARAAAAAAAAPRVRPGSRRAAELERSVRRKIELHRFAPQVEKAVFYPAARAAAAADVLAEFVVLMLSDGKSKADVNAELACLVGERYTALFAEWLFAELESVLADPRFDDGEGGDGAGAADESEAVSVSERECECECECECEGGSESEAASVSESVCESCRVSRSGGGGSGGRGSNGKNAVRRRRRRLAEDPAARYLRLRALLAERLGSAAAAPPPPAFFVRKTLPRAAAAASAASCTPEERRMDREALAAAVARAEKEARNKAVRCRYWPRCGRGGACRFRHPSELCRAFPNCPNTAMECAYIHPATDGSPGPAAAGSSSPPPPPPDPRPSEGGGGGGEIRRAAALRGNPDDPFGPRPPPAPRTPAGFSAARRTGAVCRFGAACYRPNCKYNHNPAPVPI